MRAPRESPDAARAVLRASVLAPGESRFEEVARRVARRIAEAEPAGARALWEERFYEAIASGRFVPSVPVLANAARSDQLAACFVLAPADRLADIYAALAQAARIQQLSGGVGVELSQLRPRGAAIRRAGGRSPGPVAFAELFAHSARINALSGRRPGAHLAILADDHPDVLDFVRAAGSGDARFASLGFALGVSDRLLASARRNGWHPLRHRSGTPQRVRARALLDALARSIVATGQPTLLFLDRIEADNPTPELGRLSATNPCGEQPLLAGESCVLGSLQLPAFADASGHIDRAALADSVRLAVRFLDDVIECCAFPGRACAAASRRSRKIGLGVMGLADLLLLRGLRYDAPAARRAAGEIVGAVRSAAGAASQALGRERGAFPAFRRRGPRRRNATLLAVAPTGTIRLLAGCSAGIEPLLQPVVEVETPEARARWVDPWLARWLEANAREPERVIEALASGVAHRRLPGLSARARGLLRVGAEIDWRAQLAMQAVVQRSVDGAVSKTLQLPAAATPRDVLAAIVLARRLGLKGLACYRESGAAICIDCRNVQ